MRFWLSCLLFALVLTAAGSGQDSGSGQGPSLNPPAPHLPSMSPGDSADNDSTATMQKAMAKKFNLERQAQLKRDTDKLLQLSTELKQYVDKTNANVLSIEVVKKADEIEKLARSVREKMKGGY